jgi:hypothetical protein
MQNGRHGTTDEKLDQALEDTFPGSDPVSISRPETRQGAPEQHSQSAAQSVKDTARKAARSVSDTAQTVKDRVADAAERAGDVRPDYLWLGGAFVLGAIFGIAARAAPSAFGRKSYADRLRDRGERLGRRVSGRVSDMQLKRKLEDLIERLQ